MNGRMTVGKLLEALFSNVGLAEGHFVDASPFKHLDAQWAIDRLLEAGYGTEVYMINGKTGRMMSTPWFLGSNFYQSLKHMVFDKFAARNRGPRAVLTRQPLEGRAKQGGLRVGEMERDAILAHGGSRVLDDRSRVASDGHSAPVCLKCGQIGESTVKFTLKGLLGRDGPGGAVGEAIQHEERCRICDGPVRIIDTTYCYSNLLLRELAAVGIKVEHAFSDSGGPADGPADGRSAALASDLAELCMDDD